MARQCKMCSAPKEIREKIEKSVLDGMPYKEAAEQAKQLGLNISPTSIQRHFEHMELSGNLQKHELTIPSSLDQNVLPTISTPNVTTWYEAKQYVYKNLPTLVANQMAIVIDKQNRYTKNECRYPKEETRQLLDMLKFLNIESKDIGTNIIEEEIEEEERI